MSIPIPIVGGKLKKKRGSEHKHKCESCNKMGWFESFFFFFLPSLVFELSIFFCFDFLFFSPPKKPSNMIFYPDLPPPKLVEQTQTL